MTENEIMAALKEPFDPAVLSWRVGATSKDKTKAIALAYIDARDVMKRLDDVMGLNWQNRHPSSDCCEIGLLINDEWLWRANGAGQTDIEGEKGQFSDAFKRAAVMWGIGRYLYYLPNKWVPIDQFKNLTEIPQLPAWALPKVKK